MSKLIFDAPLDRKYENGVDHAVLYTLSSDKWNGYAWNGMTSIDVSPDGGEAQALWADNMKYANMRGAVSYAATINCYSFPEEFNACLGNVEVVAGSGVYAHEQEGSPFRIVYRTALNDAQRGRYGYRYHVVYNLTCDPSDITYDTIDDSPDGVEFGFDVEGTPITHTASGKSCCEWTFDVVDADKRGSSDGAKYTKLDAIVDKLYGTNETNAECPDVDELFAGLSS